MNDKLKPAKDIVLREEEGGIFLFNPDSYAIKILNHTGVFIWKLCDGKHSQEDIVNAVVEEFDAPSKEVAKKDLEKFLKTLRDSRFFNA